MNPEAHKEFDRLLNKELHELTSDDIVFLQARRDYLKPNDKKRLASVLKTHVEKEAPAKPFGYKRGAEVMKHARELGIATKGLSRDEIERAIDTIEGAAGAPQPE